MQAPTAERCASAALPACRSSSGRSRAECVLFAVPSIASPARAPPAQPPATMRASAGLRGLGFSLGRAWQRQRQRGRAAAGPPVAAPASAAARAAGRAKGCPAAQAGARRSRAGHRSPLARRPPPSPLPLLRREGRVQDSRRPGRRQGLRQGGREPGGAWRRGLHRPDSAARLCRLPRGRRLNRNPAPCLPLMQPSAPRRTARRRAARRRRRATRTRQGDGWRACMCMPAALPPHRCRLPSPPPFSGPALCLPARCWMPPHRCRLPTPPPSSAPPPLPARWAPASATSLASRRAMMRSCAEPRGQSSAR